MNNNIITETENLIVKYGTIEDYVAVHQFDFNYLQGLKGENGKIINERVAIPPEEVRSWFPSDISIEEYHKNEELKKVYEYIIYLKKEGEIIPIGDIGFDRYDESLNSLEISCWLHPNYWGHSYTSEALIPTMDYIFSLGYDNIIYSFDSENERSRRNCEKMGFEFYECDKSTHNCFGVDSPLFIYIMSKERYYEIHKHNKKK